jgi:hypothetical protein
MGIIIVGMLFTLLICGITFGILSTFWGGKQGTDFIMFVGVTCVAFYGLQVFWGSMT